MLLRVLGLVLAPTGVVLAVVNALYLPTAVESHGGELPIIVFDVNATSGAISKTSIKHECRAL